MSRARVRQTDGEHRIRAQRTPPPASVADAWPRDATGYRTAPTPTPLVADARPGRYLPGQLGRFPTVGLDPGATPGTRPDQSSITR